MPKKFKIFKHLSRIQLKKNSKKLKLNRNKILLINRIQNPNQKIYLNMKMNPDIQNLIILETQERRSFLIEMLKNHRLMIFLNCGTFIKKIKIILKETKVITLTYFQRDLLMILLRIISKNY